MIEDNTGVAVNRKKKYNRVRTVDSDEDNVDDKDKVANEIFHDGLDSDDDIDQVILITLIEHNYENCSLFNSEQVSSICFNRIRLDSRVII